MENMLPLDTSGETTHPHACWIVQHKGQKYEWFQPKVFFHGNSEWVLSWKVKWKYLLLDHLPDFLHCAGQSRYVFWLFNDKDDDNDVL